jgi:hypothetical protein
MEADDGYLRDLDGLILDLKDVHRRKAWLELDTAVFHLENLIASVFGVREDVLLNFIKTVYDDVFSGGCIDDIDGGACLREYGSHGSARAVAEFFKMDFKDLFSIGTVDETRFNSYFMKKANALYEDKSVFFQSLLFEWGLMGCYVEGESDDLEMLLRDLGDDGIRGSEHGGRIHSHEKDDQDKPVMITRETLLFIKDVHDNLINMQGEYDIEDIYVLLRIDFQAKFDEIFLNLGMRVNNFRLYFMDLISRVSRESGADLAYFGNLVDEWILECMYVDE